MPSALFCVLQRYRLFLCLYDADYRLPWAEGKGFCTALTPLMFVAPAFTSKSAC